MDIHRTQSILLLTLGFPLLCALLSAVPLPSLRTDALLCYFCPLLPKTQSCSDAYTTQCLPDEVCASSRGHDDEGKHLLSAQGCIKRHLCGSHEQKYSFGQWYNVSHTCCCKDTCNFRSRAEEEGLKLQKGIKGFQKVDDVPDSDSCVNYTSPLAAKSMHE